MRSWLFACAVLSGLFQPLAVARASDIEVPSRIDAVTVFPSGAEVIRKATVRIPKGSQKLVLSDLPAQAIRGSIRVEGVSSGGRLQIGAVDQRRKFVLSTGRGDTDADRKRLEREIEQARERIQVLESEIENRKIQKRFIENLAALPAKSSPPSNQAAASASEDWSAVFDLIGSRLADVQSAILKTRVAIREANRQVEDLEKQLAALAPKKHARTEVTINAVASEDLEAELTVSYQVAQAGWRPLYDARLNTGSRNVAAKLVLTRRAEITQRTDEPWNAASISLSTTRPAARSGAPVLRPVTVDFEKPPPVVKKEAYADQAAQSQQRARMYRGARPNIAAAPAPVAERPAQVVSANFHALFAIPDRLTVPNTGDASRVKISDMELEPALGVRTVPKRDRQAFLYAKIKLPRTVPFLPGRVSLFRDRTFVGTGSLPLLATGETHEIGFGADDLVRVKYEVTRHSKGESGLISSSRTDQRHYKITIRNLHERPIAYTVLDQIPVAAEESIKVELRGTTQPSERNVDDKRGVLAWSGKLGADEEKMIDFGYLVSWPAEKKVEYR